MLWSVDMHAGQLDITVPVARALVDDQFPEWRDFPIRAVDGHGTVNGIFRLGDRLVLRFPLEGDDAGVVLKQLEAESAAARRRLDANMSRTQRSTSRCTPTASNVGPNATAAPRTGSRCHKPL